MTVMTRLKKSVMTGVLVSAVITGFAATRRHAHLAAAAARSTAHGQAESVNQILVTGFAATAVAAAVLVFAASTVVAVRRRRRLLEQYYRGGTAGTAGPAGSTGRRSYSGHGGYRGGW